MVAPWVILIIMLAVTPPNESVSEVRSHEEVVFFPTMAHLDADHTHWEVSIHGCVFQPEEDSTKRKALLGLLRRLAGLSEEQTATEMFKRRARVFLVDNERGRTMVIRLAGRTFELDESSANGHFESTIRVATKDIKQPQDNIQGPTRQLSFEALLPAEDNRRFSGTVALIKPEGMSVISDIDDTIKVSNVTDKAALAVNTFLLEFEAVPGIAEVYRQWHAQGAGFHYVSGSPWQLYQPLAEFMNCAGFPGGSFHLRHFRWKDASFLDLFSSPEGFKLQAIEPILKGFPERRFILVGDCGEKDPEIYGELARRFPRQIGRILIRNVNNEKPDSERMNAAMRDVPPEHWQLITHAAEISMR